jgi:hypothetical protein
VVLPLKLVV